MILDKHRKISDKDISEQEPSPMQRTPSKDVFLTFSGLMHAIHVTRLPVADELRYWVYKNVFALEVGTVEQKKELLSTLCKVNKTFLQAFMKMCPSDLACLYLVETDIPAGAKSCKVYKFGRAEKIQNRFGDHDATYRERTVLDTVVFVPANMLVEAEGVLRKSITTEAKFKYNAEKELVSLDAVSRKALRTVMCTIADKYNGSMTIQASNHAKEVKDLKHAHVCIYMGTTARDRRSPTPIGMRRDSVEY